MCWEVFLDPTLNISGIQLWEFIKKIEQNILETPVQVLDTSYKFDHIFFYNRIFSIPYLRQITFIY